MTMQQPAKLFLFVLLWMPLISCGKPAGEQAEYSTHSGPFHVPVSGKITVDPALDDTGDYSGIGLLIRTERTSPDTLFHAVTSKEGVFDGMAHFPRQDRYLLELFRNNRRLGDTTLVAGPGDTLRIEGQLPRFAGNARIVSRENDAMRTLVRIERHYNRIAQIAQMGGLPQDTIPVLLDNWSDIYWEVFENYPGTVAGVLAAGESLRLLENVHDRKLMQRLRENMHDEPIQRLAASTGFVTILREEGLDPALHWLDSLEARSTDSDIRIRIAMNRIEVLYDSARTARARDYLARFKEEIGRFRPDQIEATAEWVESMEYDITHLAAGQILPSFQAEFFDTVLGEGEPVYRTLSLDDLKGSPALIEVVRLADRNYQMNYNQLRILYQAYRKEGVRFITLPVETSPVVVRAFYEDRGQDWPVARAGAFAGSTLEEQWNTRQLPVRFLIDAEGRIIRKLYGSNMTDLLAELSRIIGEPQSE